MTGNSIDIKKKIFVISNMYPSLEDPSYGIFVKKFVDGIIESEYSLAYLAVIRGKPNTFFRKLKSYFLFYLNIIWGVLFKKYDMIYVHYVTHSSIILLLLVPFIRKPIILNFHGGDLLPIHRSEKFFQPFSKILIKYAKLIVVPSVFFKNIVINRYRLKEDLIFVYPSAGIDPLIFKPIDYQRERTVNNYKVIGYVSRIAKGKGWDVLLKALSLIKLEMPDLAFKAIFAGKGAEIDRFRSLTKDLNIEDNILYIGEVENKKLPELFNSFDLFVFPTELNESLGLVALEAMSCGIPVIVSYQAAMKEYVIDNENGFFFKKGDAKSLSTIILKVLFLSEKEKEEVKKQAFFTVKSFEEKNLSESLINKLREVITEFKN